MVRALRARVAQQGDVRYVHRMRERLRKGTMRHCQALLEKLVAAVGAMLRAHTCVCHQSHCF